MEKNQTQVGTGSFNVRINIAIVINLSSEISENWNIKGNTKGIELYT